MVYRVFYQYGTVKLFQGSTFMDIATVATKMETESTGKILKVEFVAEKI